MSSESNLPTLELNPTEQQDIGFKLKMMGSDKDIGSSKPTIRFVLSEQDTGKGWIFATEKTENGYSVSIPVMKGIISEDKKYGGKLEVILEGRYFPVNEVNINFIEPIKIESTIFTVKKSDSNNTNTKLLEEEKKNVNKSSEEFTIESEIESIIVKDNKNTTSTIREASKQQNNKQEDIEQIIREVEVVTSSKKPKDYSELSKEQKNDVNKLFLEKCSKFGISSKEVKNLMSEGTSYTKKRLTALLAQATKEFIEKL